MINAVLFDLWGTLIENTWLKPSTNKLMEFLGENNRLLFEKSRIEWQTKDLSTEEFFTQLTEKASVSADVIPKLVEIWEIQFTLNQLYSDSIPALVEARNRGLKTGLVSNAAPIAKKALNDLKLANYFDSIIISCDVGVRKPDEKIYEKSLSELKIQPEEALFVGNELLNDVEAPRKLGMSAVLLDRSGSEPDSISNLMQLFDLIK